MGIKKFIAVLGVVSSIIGSTEAKTSTYSVDAQVSAWDTLLESQNINTKTTDWDMVSADETTQKCRQKCIKVKSVEGYPDVVAFCTMVCS